jgi:PAS domain S-box-containing protein
MSEDAISAFEIGAKRAIRLPRACDFLVDAEEIRLCDGQTETWFRSVLDVLPAAVYTTDVAGRITYYNEAAVELAGRRPVLGHDEWCVTWRLYNPDGTPMPHERCPMAIALRENRAVRGAEAILERPDGTRLNFIPYPTPLRDVAGRLIGAVNMLVDVSERKVADNALAYLAAIVESTADAVVSKDLDGIVTSWNRGAEGIFGYSAAEMVGQPIALLFPPDRLGEEDLILSRLRRGESVEHFETLRRRKDGQLIDVSISISPVRDSTGRIIGAAKIARDITERKRADALLRDLNEHLERRVAERTHELGELNRRLMAEMAERDRSEAALHHCRRWRRRASWRWALRTISTICWRSSSAISSCWKCGSPTRACSGCARPRRGRCSVAPGSTSRCWRSRVSSAWRHGRSI